MDDDKNDDKQAQYKLKRLQKEWEMLQKKPVDGCEARPVIVKEANKIDWFHWVGSVSGPVDSPYEGGIFHFKVDYSNNDYPWKPPRDVQFTTTKIYHYGILESSGHTCLDTLKDNWSPTFTIRNILMMMQSFLKDCDPKCVLNPICATVYMTDRAKYEQIARDWTRQYAMQTTTIQTAAMGSIKADDIEENNEDDLVSKQQR